MGEGENGSAFSPRRLLAYARRESLELWREAFIGANDIQNIVTGEVNEFMRHQRAEPELPIKLITHLKSLLSGR